LIARRFPHGRHKPKMAGACALAVQRQALRGLGGKKARTRQSLRRCERDTCLPLPCNTNCIQPESTTSEAGRRLDHFCTMRLDGSAMRQVLFVLGGPHPSRRKGPDPQALSSQVYALPMSCHLSLHTALGDEHRLHELPLLLQVVRHLLNSLHQDSGVQRHGRATQSDACSQELLCVDRP